MSTIPHDQSHTVQGGRSPPLVQPAAYEQKVDEAVSQFEAAADGLAIPRPPTAELREVCRKVAAYTAELCPGEMSIAVTNDPEITGVLYFVFEVAVNGSVEEIVALNDEWHRRLRAAVGTRRELFCLSISPLS